mmetsp:Transcript_13530/g.38448  ORF Transcript_13530/g.38448 Transcript_13530/m.38448 type:complete len:121 (+) Transcript_13530:118-480(+)
MLKLKIIPQVLEQANTGGVEGTILVNAEGSLLSSAGKNAAETKSVAAIASNVWNSYQNTAEGAGNLEFLSLVCERASIVVTSCGNFLLVLYGNGASFGMMKTKATALKRHLHEPLSTIAS